MKRRTRRTVRLGDLVVAAWDQAASYSTNPREVSRLATQAVVDLLNRGIGRGDDRALRSVQ